MTEFLVIAAAYALGSIDFGVIVPRLLGVDIYREGSGNPGTSNVFRTLGTKAAIVVMLGDAAKGALAAGIGAAVGDATLGFACGLAAVLGHSYPVWHRFKGGKGVATALGVAIWMAPVAGIVLTAGWGAAVAATKTASIASLAVMAAYVPLIALTGTRGVPLLLAGVIALVVLVRHAGNIIRLVSGAERRIDST